MLAIFKRDFKSYFTSPLGYVYIGAYIFVMNLYFFFINILQGYSSLAGDFSFMITIMMFTTPILTMRIFSEDLKQKTDQLLFTSPVKLTGIVVGKFLSAMMVYASVLVLTLSWPLVISLVGTNNVAEVAANYAGIICIGAAYISMGVFISSLTENQLIAAVGSLGLFIALWMLDFIPSIFSTSFPAWIVTVLNFISIFGRYNSITAGVFTISDIVFFLSVTAAFLFVTVRRLDKRRWA